MISEQCWEGRCTTNTIQMSLFFFIRMCLSWEFNCRGVDYLVNWSWFIYLLKVTAFPQEEFLRTYSGWEDNWTMFLLSLLWAVAQVLRHFNWKDRKIFKKHTVDSSKVDGELGKPRQEVRLPLWFLILILFYQFVSNLVMCDPQPLCDSVCKAIV